MAEAAEQVEAIMMEDAQGNIYALPVEHMEKFRVPDDKVAELKQMAEQTASQADDDEVSGYWWWNWNSQPVVTQHSWWNWGGGNIINAGAFN